MRSGDTKKQILQAFNTIAAANDFQRISVDDIVRRAGVCRATFYRHFKDKYDVMNYNYTNLLNESLGHQKCRTMEDLFVLILEEGRRNWNKRSALFDTWGANSLSGYIQNYSYTVARNLYETGDPFGQGEKRHELNEKGRIHLRFFCAGAASFFEEWVRGKHRMSARQAAAIMYEMLPGEFRGNIREL